MVTRENFKEKVLDLLEEVEAEGDVFTFSEKARALVKECADYARSTELYKNAEDQRNEFWKDLEVTPTNVYLHLLDRIIRAPRTFLMITSAIIFIPTLDEALDAEAVNREE